MKNKYAILLLSCTVINETTQVATFAVQDADWHRNQMPGSTFTVRTQTVIDGKAKDSLIVRQGLTVNQLSAVIFSDSIEKNYLYEDKVQFLVESFMLTR